MKLSELGEFDGNVMTLREAFDRQLATVSTSKMQTKKRLGERRVRQAYWLNCADGSGCYEIGKLAYLSLIKQPIEREVYYGNDSF